MGLFILRHIFSWLTEGIPSVNRTLTFLILQFSIFFLPFPLLFLFCLFLFIDLAESVKYSPLVTAMTEDLVFYSDHLVNSVRWIMEIYSLLGERWLRIWLTISLFICLLMSSNKLRKWFIPTEKENTYLIPTSNFFIFLCLLLTLG